jgi:hypothetical protein
MTWVRTKTSAYTRDVTKLIAMTAQLVGPRYKHSPARTTRRDVLLWVLLATICFILAILVFEEGGGWYMFLGFIVLAGAAEPFIPSSSLTHWTTGISSPPARRQHNHLGVRCARDRQSYTYRSYGLIRR